MSSPRVEFVLEALGIEKSYGATSVLRKANLRVAQGEIHALLGGNGAGKSTFIRIVSGSLRRDSGVISVEGREHYDAQRDRASSFRSLRFFRSSR